jgi:Holliday junction resolvase RusA-like endonuclease
MRVYTILGIPRPQGRPRFFRKGNFVGTYDPKESRQYKENVSAQLVAQSPAILDGPVTIKLDFFLPRPKSLPKKVVHHVKKPDVDNLIKGVFDACKGILWHDDTQVVDMTCAKFYGDPPKVIIEVGQHV